MKFRKKPVVIEAEQYEPGLEDGFETMYIDPSDPTKAWGIPTTDKDIEIQIPYIETLEGRHLISNGDWIITGVKGERYPCKPDIFEMTYEPVEEGGDAE